jgi:tripartite-type tricarboxylate transporter receptor subunit TctC
MKPPRRRLLLLLAAAAVHAQAQDFPTRTVRMIVPFAAGSPTDALARAVADGIAEDLQQPVIVDNRPGAGSTIGAAAAAKAPADGYTLYFGTSAHAISATIHRSLPHDSVNAFAGVSQVGAFRFTLFTRPMSDVQDLAGLVTAMKANPGKFSYGSSGVGSALHLATELFNDIAGVNAVHVPFKGGNEVLTGLLSGTIDYGFFSLQSALPHVQSGKLKALAVAAPKREALAPDIPTFAEAGFPQYDAETWNAIFVPRGTPEAVIRRLHQAVRAALNAPSVRSRAEAMGAELTPQSTPEATDALLRKEVARWRQVVESRGIQVQ